MTAAFVGAGLLLLANAFFVWAEFAFAAAPRTRLESLAEAGSRPARLALAAAGNLDTVLAGAQLGITMASLGLGFVAEPSIGRLLERPLELLPEGLRHPTEVTLALGLAVVAHMVIGEMVPKNLAIAEPERSALWLAGPYRVYDLAFRPLIRSLNAVANRVVRLLGVEPPSERPGHSAEEIGAMLELSGAAGVIDPFEYRLLSRALGLGKLEARAAMIPRPDVVAVSEGATVVEAEELVLRTGHSRLPVFRGDLDEVVGFVHAKDLLRVSEEERGRRLPGALLRPLVVVPESRSLLDVLADMRRHRTHLAAVVDEHGGVAGIVTLEDVLEELVGEIRDEYDRGGERLWRLGPRRVLVNAGLRPDEIEGAIGLAIPEGDYETVGGFVMARLGRVPQVADEVEVDGWVLRVRRMEGHRVELVEIVAPPGESPAPGSL